MDHVEEAYILDTIDGVGTDRFSTDAHQGIMLHDFKWTVVN
jgi:hypothetical protein